VSLITPTCDRPVAFALTEAFMGRQTRQPDEWIVADGGRTPLTCTRGQRHVLGAAINPGPENFAANVLRAVDAATGDLIVVIEDDDWYHPTHIEQLVARFDHPKVLIAGDDDQRYYNVARRCWRVFQNKGGCFCQTAFRRDLIPTLRAVTRECEARRSYGVDTKFWASVPMEQWSLRRDHTVVGIKGLPGQAGLGIGHRPNHQWNADPTLEHLRQWVGDDVALYANLQREVAA
jgi:glycosyltransferase involved in cell wall biosynthesis